MIEKRHVERTTPNIAPSNAGISVMAAEREQSSRSRNDITCDARCEREELPQHEFDEMNGARPMQDHSYVRVTHTPLNRNSTTEPFLSEMSMVLEREMFYKDPIGKD
jgi:hypothetical protein